MLAAFQVNSWVALIATLGTILSAAYALYLYRRVVFGKLEKVSLKGILDLSPREIAILAPLLLLTLYYGFHPQPILDSSQATVDGMMKTFAASAAPHPVAAASLKSAPTRRRLPALRATVRAASDGFSPFAGLTMPAGYSFALLFPELVLGIGALVLY